MCKDKEKKVDFRMQFLDFLQQKFIVFQSSSVPLFTCIFFAEKAKKDTASIGARLEVLVFRRLLVGVSTQSCHSEERGIFASNSTKIGDSLYGVSREGFDSAQPDKTIDKILYVRNKTKP